MSLLRNTPAAIVADLGPVQDFYGRHFDATPVFDGAGYLILRLGAKGAPELAFMEPREGMTVFAGGGITYNLEFGDVDAAYDRLTGAGLVPAMPLEDHPWGDRGFAVVDPVGILLYCYEPIEPAPEFKAFLCD